MPYNSSELIQELQMNEEFLGRVLKAFDESDSTFTPAAELFPPEKKPMSVAAQVAHIGITVDWFVDRWEKDEWDMDFETHLNQAHAVKSLAEAKALTSRAFARARDFIQADDGKTLQESLPPDDALMPNMPKFCLVGAISDHTAHHRGSLSVYLRQLGKIPPLPYMDE